MNTAQALTRPPVSGRRHASDPSQFDPVRAYGEWCRPKLADLLEALGLQVSYHRAQGSHVFTRDEDDNERAVLDLVGGFGATLFGHNNPDLKEAMIRLLFRGTPTFVQGGTRPEAARLARRMNVLLGTTGRYYTHFLNSGTESVEAVVKHAYKVRLDAIVETYESVSRDLTNLYNRCEDLDEPVSLPDQFDDLTTLRDRIDEHNLGEFERFQHHPVVCALKGSFHGKTSSALKLTFNKTYREGFEGLSAIETAFFESDRPERLKELEREHRITFLRPVISENGIVIEPVSVTTIIAAIIEVIQGEGGVRPVPEESLRALAEMHGELGIPYIVDEIQTGCGRTGTFVAYQSTPLGAIEPDYLTFGKALGGGLVKISAAMIHESVYDPDFGLLHTSTFGEDELSCAVAYEALGLLVKDGEAVMRDVEAKGEYFRSALERLQASYPTIVREIRGKGLMLGLELTDLEQQGHFFRYAGHKGFASLLVASYLLHHHDIRVLAPLSTLFKGNPGARRPSILRIQPAVTITRGEIDRFVAALDDVLGHILRCDEFAITAHLAGADFRPDDAGREGRPTPPDTRRTRFDARVGFLVNITRVEDLVDHYLPTYRDASFDERALCEWWNRLSRFLEPEVVHTSYVESDGFSVEANIVAVPYLARQMMKTYAAGRRESSRRFDRLRLKELRDKVRDAAILARDLGDERVPTSLVGLGAFTSIVTENGMTMNDYEIPVTTGNTYTSALLLQSTLKAAEMSELDIEECTAAVVGAAGNIGSVMARLLTFHAGRIYLVGRDTRISDDRMDDVRRQCLHDVAERVAGHMRDGYDLEEIEMRGIAGTVFRTVICPALDDGPDETLRPVIDALTDGKDLPRDTGARIERSLGEAGVSDLFTTAPLGAVSECHVVTVATNSTNGRLIGPDDVRPGAVVGCASVPSNLSRSFAGRENEFFVFDGGYARLPEDGVIDFTGMPRDGLAFGCLSETLLLGFHGVNRSFAKGTVDPAQVLQTMEMASDYGFGLGDFQLNGRPLGIITEA